MNTFVIDAENSITAVDTPEEAHTGETWQPSGRRRAWWKFGTASLG
jgi:hypothetical protein